MLVVKIIQCLVSIILLRLKKKIKEKIKEKTKVFSMLYNVYKNNNGAKSWIEFLKAVKSGDITFEMQPISVFIK